MDDNPRGCNRLAAGPKAKTNGNTEFSKLTELLMGLISPNKKFR
jgi:hypothetical protein